MVQCMTIVYKKIGKYGTMDDLFTEKYGAMVDYLFTLITCVFTCTIICLTCYHLSLRCLPLLLHLHLHLLHLKPHQTPLPPHPPHRHHHLPLHNAPMYSTILLPLLTLPHSPLLTSTNYTFQHLLLGSKTIPDLLLHTRQLHSLPCTFLLPCLTLPHPCLPTVPGRSGDRAR